MPTKNAATKYSWKFLLRSDISWPTYVLIVVFGLGSWIAVNGLWVELPILVQFAPEKWDLPSYLTVIVQLANVGPLAYSIGNHFAPRSVSEKPVVLLIVLIGSVSCALLAFFWNKTSFVGGVEHSTALLVLSFCLAIVDCTSSVVFLTFMGLFPSSYMSALFVGETMSGMLPSFVALGQGVVKGSSASCNKTSQNITNTSSSHHNADTGLKFGPEPFFFFLFSMMIACGLAFMGLNYLPFAKKQHVRTISQRSGEEERQSLIRSDSFAHHENGAENFSTETHSTSFSSFTHHHVIYLLCIQAWINCLSNGVVSSIQAYAYEPYGNETYHLVVTLGFISNALVCFIALWIPSRSSALVTVYASLYTLLSAYVLAMAAMSPTPLLYKSKFGSVIITLVSVAKEGLINYTKLTICSIMRDRGQRALFWCGISIQTGSCIGALIMFPLVNVFKFFHQAESC